MPALTDINNYFLTRKNQFHKNLYQRNWRSNPFIGMFKRTDFDVNEGRVPEVVTTTHHLPASYPFGLTKIGLSSGSGNTACLPTATTIKSGSKKRTFEIEVDAFDTEPICLTDVQFAHQAAKLASNKEKGLKEYSTVRISDWYRVHNIGMLDKKVSTLDATSLDRKSDALQTFATLSLPVAEFNWIHAGMLYDELCRNGAEEFSVGHAMGEPVFALCIGPGYKRELFQSDELVRETVNYGKALENFRARGITQAVNGYVPNVDLFPIRYAADGSTAIYPTINQATTIGEEAVTNPDYATVENGGLAVYEVIEILCRDIYEVCPRPVGPTAFSKEGFNAVNYSGEVNWINNKDMDKNILGNFGFYRMDIQMAFKPIYPELGFSVLTLAKD